MSNLASGPLALTGPLLLAGLLGACSPAPAAEDVAPAIVPVHSFAGLSCAELAAEQTLLNRRLAALTAEQEQTRVDDSYGLFWTWRPLASMTGGDQRDRIALAKGELQLANQMLASHCPLPPAPVAGSPAPRGGRAPR